MVIILIFLDVGSSPCAAEGIKNSYPYKGHYLLINIMGRETYASYLFYEGRNTTRKDKPHLERLNIPVF
ncbi:MAG: hypothetical protein RMI63_06245 [Caldimicrobium sp.]|nr:hypothetical protein [Caldimicrobium sp.]